VQFLKLLRRVKKMKRDRELIMVLPVYCVFGVYEPRKHNTGGLVTTPITMLQPTSGDSIFHERGRSKMDRGGERELNFEKVISKLEAWGID